MSAFKRPAGARPAGVPAPQVPAARVSKYADVSTAKIFREGNYVKPVGRMIAMIERIEEGTTNKKKQDFVAIQLLPLLVENTGMTSLDLKVGGENRVGESVSDFNTIGNTSFGSKMMKFATVATNMTQEEILAAEREVAVERGLDPAKGEANGLFIEEIVSEAQPLAGIIVELEAHVRRNQNAKNTPEEQLRLTGDRPDVFTKIVYKRRVPFAELPELIDAAVLARYVPDLDAKIAEEAAEAASAEAS